VALGTEIHKRRLQAGFNPGDAAFIYIGFFLFAGAVFDVQVIKLLTIDEGDAELFGVRRID